MSQKWVAVPWDKFQELTSQEFQEQTGGSPKPQSLSTETLLGSIPKRNRREAAAILSYIEKSPNLSWSQQGELVVEGQIVPRTHVSDLLKDAFYKHKNWEPEGVNEFYRELAKSNLPTALIRNQERRALLETYKQAKPPGVLASKWLAWK